MGLHHCDYRFEPVGGVSEEKKMILALLICRLVGWNWRIGEEEL